MCQRSVLRQKMALISYLKQAWRSQNEDFGFTYLSEVSGVGLRHTHQSHAIINLHLRIDTLKSRKKLQKIRLLIYASIICTPSPPPSCSLWRFDETLVLPSLLQPKQRRFLLLRERFPRSKSPCPKRYVSFIRIVSIRTCQCVCTCTVGRVRFPIASGIQCKCCSDSNSRTMFAWFV